MNGHAKVGALQVDGRRAMGDSCSLARALLLVVVVAWTACRPEPPEDLGATEQSSMFGDDGRTWTMRGFRPNTRYFGVQIQTLNRAEVDRVARVDGSRDPRIS